MKSILYTFIRAAATVAIFVIIFSLSDYFIFKDFMEMGYELENIRGETIDRAITYLAAVTGAGCYWIGSRPN